MLGWEFPPHITGGLATACLGLCEGLHAQGVEVCFVVPRARGDEDQRFARVIGANQIWLRRELVAAASANEIARGASSASAALAVSTSDRSSSTAPSAAAPAAPAQAQGLPADHSHAPSLAPVAQGLSFVDREAGDEPLSAYFTPEQYQRWLARLARLELRESPERPEFDAPAIECAALSHAVESSPSHASPSHASPSHASPSHASPAQASPAQASHAQASPAQASHAHASHESHNASVAESPAQTPPAPLPSAPALAPTRVVSERLEFRGDYGADLFGEVERYARCVAELVERERFDLVHAHDWMTFPAGELAAQRLSVPLVAHVHASEYDRSGEHPDERIRRIEQRGVDVASRVVCVSHYTAGIVRTRYHAADEKLRVVHNAVTRTEQRERLRTTKSVPEPIVLFLGRVTFQKGPEYFLEAARRVVDVEPRVKFVMVGAGDMLPKMVERAARMGLARHVHFTGFLKGPDVERIYSMADVYVMPSVSEPFGISPLEALALDTPVIVSRQSGVSEVLSNALKVDFWDVDEIANKIVALLRYPALRDHVRAAGGDEVRAMSWLDRGRRLREVYGELLG